jgi:hypothetical protein
VGCKIIHQDGDGGDEAWVGAVEILEDLEILFELQLSAQVRKRKNNEMSPKQTNLLMWVGALWLLLIH